MGRSQLNAASTRIPPTGFPVAGAAAVAQPSAATPESEEPEEEVTLEDLEERAKSGDARAQSKMGRYFLALAEERDEELNNCTAVTWLVQAAKQGRKDAVKQLQRCLSSRKGITLENIEEVKKLCTETRFERGVRKAALLMYWRLNPERKKSVTVSEMLENVEHVHAEPGKPVLPGPLTALPRNRGESWRIWSPVKPDAKWVWTTLLR